MEQLVVGRTDSLMVNVANEGPAMSTATSVIIDLPASVLIGNASGDGTCSRSGGQVTCMYGSIEAGNSMQTMVRLTPQMPGTVGISAITGGDEIDNEPSNNSVFITRDVMTAETKGGGGGGVSGGAAGYRGRPPLRPGKAAKGRGARPGGIASVQCAAQAKAAPAFIFITNQIGALLYPSIIIRKAPPKAGLFFSLEGPSGLKRTARISRTRTVTCRSIKCRVALMLSSRPAILRIPQ
jgi:hypothetical protein